MKYKKNYYFEKNYNPRVSVPNFENYLNKALMLSKKASEELKGIENIKYGNGPLQNLDIFGADKDKEKPIFIFLHGGYWRCLDKSYHTHMAKPFVKKGIIFVNVNYDLCPKVKVTTIEKQVTQAVIWIYKNIHRYGGIKTKIVICGHSAGAHLAALMVSKDWKKYNIKNRFFIASVLLSGIFDTELVLKLEVNNDIRMSIEEAKRLNPLDKHPNKNVKFLLSYGELEPELWKKQTIKYSKLLTTYKIPYSLVELKKQNHFSMINSITTDTDIFLKKIFEFFKE